MNDPKDNERVIHSQRTFMIFIFDRLLFSKNIQTTLNFRNKKIKKNMFKNKNKAWMFLQVNKQYTIPSCSKRLKFKTKIKYYIIPVSAVKAEHIVNIKCWWICNYWSEYKKTRCFGNIWSLVGVFFCCCLFCFFSSIYKFIYFLIN